MRKIIYMHGLSSSGASHTATNLRTLLPDDTVISPDIPMDPYEALNMLRELCNNEQPDIIVGTSMGGMFAQQMFGYQKIIVNPAFHVSRIMRKEKGTHQFFAPRKDGIMQFEITDALCDKYEEMERHQFEGMTDFDRENTYGLFGRYDTTVNCYDEFMKYYTKASMFEGEHRLSFENARDVIAKLIVETVE